MRDYTQGQLVRLSAAFTDAAGAAADPTSVTFRHRPVSVAGSTSTTHTYPSVGTEIVRDSIGKYHIDVSMDDPGTHYWRWESTGSAQAADQGELRVIKALL